MCRTSVGFWKTVNYLNLDEIQKIQIDHTSRCNCSCPQCARMFNDSLNPSMPITDLTVADYEIMLEPFKENQITLFHCGNYGDVIASPTFDAAHEYCLTKNVKHIRIATNGSMRKPEWWADLAKKSKDKLSIIFSIDGLADTNHLYRVGSNFNKIIENASAFIDNGGIAEWAFIEFQHNYHQIDEAQELANKLGFNKFTVKYTARFADQNQSDTVTKKGNVVKDTDNNRNTVVKKSIENFDNYVLTTPISCKYKKDKTVFIDMTMKMWPCCWLGAPNYFHHKNKQQPSFDHLKSLYGDSFNDMRVHGWDVLNHEFFSSYLNNSWNNQDNKFRRIYTCGRTCGEKFEFSSGHGKNKNDKQLTGSTNEK